MASPKNRRPKRGSHISIPQYNADRRKRNLKHEIRLTEKKLDKLLKRNRGGLLATPGRKKVWDDSRKNVVKVIQLPKKQGITRDSERHTKLLTHLDYLRKELNRQ